MSANTPKNICESMLTHVHKVIHFVVSTFEKGGDTWDQKEVLCSDQTLPHVRSVACSEGHPRSFYRTLKSKRDQTCRGCIRSPADVW
jgi:hypothetical protein